MRPEPAESALVLGRVALEPPLEVLCNIIIIIIIINVIVTIIVSACN